PLLLLLASALAADRQHAALHLDLDVLLLEAGQLGGQKDALLLFDDVHGRNPRPQAHLLVPLAPGQPAAEDAVNTVLERAQLTIRVPRHEIHGSILLDWIGKPLLQTTAFSVFSETGLRRTSILPSPDAVIAAVSPASISFFRIRSASASITSFWMSRFNGLAPNVGAYPPAASACFALSVHVSAIPRSATVRASPLSWISTICAISSRASRWKTMTSSMRLKNSGRKWRRSDSSIFALTSASSMALASA